MQRRGTQNGVGTFLDTPRLPLLDGLYRLRAPLIRSRALASEVGVYLDTQRGEEYLFSLSKMIGMKTCLSAVLPGLNI